MGPKPGELIVCHDVLSCGSLPPFESFEQWFGVRHAFWRTVWDGHDEPLLTGFHTKLPVNEATLRLADSITVWLGVGAAEQLLLAWIAQLLKFTRSRAKLSVVQYTGDVWVAPGQAWEGGKLCR